MTALPLVQSCSRSFFVNGVSRVIQYDDVSRFIRFDEITRQMVNDCPILAVIASSDATKYLAEFCGVPGLVKGVGGYGNGQLVFSEDIKFFTRVSDTRVSENRIKFEYGSREFKQTRSDCWEFAVKRCRIDVVIPIKTATPETAVSTFILSREDEKKCPVCLDDLSGNVIKCKNNHQTCFKCFELLSGDRGQKKCCLCNIRSYEEDELEKYDKMKGKKTFGEKYFYLDLHGGNSFKDFTYNEALFLGMLKSQSQSCYMRCFETMLISSFYNFYISHPDAFSTYDFNILRQVDGNSRFLKYTHDLNNALEIFIDKMLNPEYFPKIYKDVAYTSIYLRDYSDIDFNTHLEELEKENAFNKIKEYPGYEKKSILMREIYFRYTIGKMNREQIISAYKSIFEKILKNANGSPFYFNQYEEEGQEIEE